MVICRIDIRIFKRIQRALRLRIESTDGFNIVSEKLDAHRLVRGQVPDVKNVPAHGKLSGGFDLCLERITQTRKALLGFLQADRLSCFEMKHLCAHFLFRGNQVHEGLGRKDDGVLLFPGEVSEDIHPLLIQQVARKIRGIEQKVLRRIDGCLRFIEPEVFIKSLGRQFIFRNHHGAGYIKRKPIYHMGLLRIDASGQGIDSGPGLNFFPKRTVFRKFRERFQICLHLLSAV